MPEIDFSGQELDTNVGLAIPLSLYRNNPSVCLAVAVFVHQLQNLPHHDDAVELHQCAVLAHAAGIRVHAEFFAFIRFAVHRQRHGQIHSQCSPALFTAKMK